MELLPWLACSLEWFSTTKYMFFCVYQNAKMAASAEQSCLDPLDPVISEKKIEM
jgi:hypothetical protein